MSAQKIKEVLDKRGWCKGSMELEDGKVCLLGAARAASITEHGHPLWHGNSTIDRLNKVILEQYPDRTHYDESDLNNDIGPYSYDNLWIFNDHEETTYEDVQRVLEKAAVEES